MCQWIVWHRWVTGHLQAQQGATSMLMTGLAISFQVPLQWRHNERDGVSNHRRLDCLLIRLFRCRSKKTSKLRLTDLCEGNSPVTGEFPAERPVTRLIFPFDDVIMNFESFLLISNKWSMASHEILNGFTPIFFNSRHHYVKAGFLLKFAFYLTHFPRSVLLRVSILHIKDEAWYTVKYTIAFVIYMWATLIRCFIWIVA